MNFDLPILAPSILAADFTKLGSDVQDMLDGGGQWIHCDIMDGHFVPNISYGPSVVKQVRTVSGDAFMDVHLMIEDPDRYIEDFVNAGADMITVHIEACDHLHRTIQSIKKYGIMAGVALNPATSLFQAEPIMEYVDMVLLMSVNPGFGGQSFIESTHDRLRELADIRETGGYGFLIEVDGGVNLKNIKQTAESGADVLVAGSSVFKASDITARVKELKSLIS